MEKRTYKVHPEDHDTRIDRWCQRILGKAPNSVYQKAIRKGLVRVQGKKVEASTRVTRDQTVEVRGFIGMDHAQHEVQQKPKKEFILTEEVIAEVRGMVVHKDDDIIVINKPAGLPVQGGSKVSKHLDAMLPALQYEARDVPRLVHRLDKDTSGILVLARNVRAASELQRCFANKRLQKFYVALVVGVPNPRRGEIESNMEKVAKGESSHERVRSVDQSGKRAVTRYNTLQSMAGKLALVELEPVTGRTHQLRVHMAELENPIVGDGKYGGVKAHVKGSVDLSSKLHLHAWRLELPAMFGHKARVFAAALPQHFAQSLEALNIDIADYE
jgi:23S rRNA pseudouridine955/2504/2580 synthase